MGSNIEGGYVTILSMSKTEKFLHIKAKNLRRIREERQLSQSDIAEILKCKASNVSDMERSRRAVTDRVIDILCIHLQIKHYEFCMTHETPIIKEGVEAELLDLLRKAESLGLTQEIIRFIKHRIREAELDKAGEQ